MLQDVEVGIKEAFVSVSGTHTSARMRALTIALLLIFFLVLIWFARQSPLTFDDAFNANVALSIAQGLGYGTHIGGVYFGFSPFISTGFAFIGPFGEFLKLSGASIGAVQVYSLLVTFFFFIVALVHTWRIHQCIPLVVILLSIAFLTQGKTDLVANTSVASLPEPMYGLWFQFIGNMSGVWALIACVSACASRVGSRWSRLLVVFCCAAYSCNAKVAHALPLTVALFFLFLFDMRGLLSSIVGVLGVLVGIKLDAGLARATLSDGAFGVYREVARSFFISNQRVYYDLVQSPSWPALVSIFRTIPGNISSVFEYVGGRFSFFACVVFFVACVRLPSQMKGDRAMNLLRFQCALGAATVVVMLWWAGMPAAPTRFLTSARPLLVATCAVACVALTSVSGRWVKAAVISGLAYCTLHALFDGMTVYAPTVEATRKVRAEQKYVAELILRVKTRRKRSVLCGEGWWYPHEMAFLSQAPKTIPCSSNSSRQVVIPKHIFPQEVAVQMKSDDCVSVFSGEYYDLLACGRGAKKSEMSRVS